MAEMSARMGSCAASGSQLDDPYVEELITQIREIGLARFVGRINAGVISPDEGYQAVERFVAAEKQRPLLSRLGQLLVGRPDHYAPKTRY